MIVDSSAIVAIVVRHEATKSDIDAIRAIVRADPERNRSNASAHFDAVNKRLDAHFEALKTRLDMRVKALTERLSTP